MKTTTFFKECRWSLGAKSSPSNSQQGNRGFDPMTTTGVNLEVDFSPEPLDENSAQPTPRVQP